MHKISGFEYLFLIAISVAGAALGMQVVRYATALVQARNYQVVAPEYRVNSEHIRVLNGGSAIKQELLRELDQLGPGDRVHIAVYRWTDDDLAVRCIDAGKAGAEVQVITDCQAPALEGSCFKKLARAGIPIWIFPIQGNDQEKRALMHHKIITLYRQTTGQYIVGTGSYNFTRSAAQKNCENLVLINNQDVYTAFEDIWHTTKRVCTKWA